MRHDLQNLIFDIKIRYDAHIQNIISQRHVKVESRSIAHFSRLFQYFPHAFTCNTSCVKVL